MASYKSLQDLLKRALKWEEEILSLYDVAKIGLADENSKNLITRLDTQQKRNLEILGGIDVTKYGPNEWVRFSIEYHDEQLIPRKTVKRDSSPQEIVTAILDYERKLKDYYQTIHDSLVSKSQKELFASLVQFRDKQIKQLHAFL
ncbi:MAG: hypothetical protein WD492_02530 [Alkalispirochaeta sp.]